jgi:membrane protease YdiL (CAAX protease family)
MTDRLPAKASAFNIPHLLLYILTPLLWLVLYFIIKVSLPLLFLVGLQAVIAIYFLLFRPRLFAPGLFFVVLLLTTYLPLPASVWLINIFISVAVISALAIIIKPLRKLFPRLPMGHIDKRILVYMLAIIVISSSALLAWKAFFHPDFSNLIALADSINRDLLLPAVIGFSIFNAIAEELMFRWIMWDGLTELLAGSASIVIVQALIFGLSHYLGFPNGWLGVAMAFCYGLMLGFIRVKGRGLLAPVLTHVFADLTIILIVFSSAGMI